MSASIKAIESRARRVAARHGFIASKSLWRRDSCDNHGEFMLVDDRNRVVLGTRYDATADEIFEFLRDRETS